MGFNSGFKGLSSGGGRVERVVAILGHRSTVKNVGKRIVCNDRITVFKLEAEPVVFDSASIGL
jgi:hypothetical protein